MTYVGRYVFIHTFIHLKMIKKLNFKDFAQGYTAIDWQTSGSKAGLISKVLRSTPPPVTIQNSSFHADLHHVCRGKSW